MIQRILVPLLIGLVGCAILIGLGSWQVQRLAWKEAMLADIAARIGADPVPLPDAPDAATDAFLPVRATGISGEDLRVLASVKLRGAGYRMISVFETEAGRRVLLDRGFRRVESDGATSDEAVTVTGNLHWPQETDRFTPAPERDTGLWFARDVPAMAEALNTEPVLIVARDLAPNPFATTPLPVGTGGIPNDHLQYAITWFSLAAVWAGMTAYWLWRITRRAT